jgi:hypothetical protein
LFKIAKVAESRPAAINTRTGRDHIDLSQGAVADLRCPAPCLHQVSTQQLSQHSTAPYRSPSGAGNTYRGQRATDNREGGEANAEFACNCKAGASL